MKKAINLSLLMVVLGLATAKANAAVCVTDGPIAMNDQMVPQIADLESSDDLVQETAFQCKTMHVTDKTLEALSISTEAGSLYAACTGVGAPVAVTLSGVSLGLQAIKLIVSSLPCDDQDNDKKVQAKIHEAVCEELSSQGIKCNG